MNEHDSVKMRGLLASIGFQETAEAAKADLLLFNTCTVRAKAHQKAFSEIGRAVKVKNDGQKTLIGVCGCVAQEEGSRILSRFPEVDIIFGPDQIYKLPELIDWVEKEQRPAIATELINSQHDYHFLDGVEAMRLKGPTAFVTIMKGCNSRCSYCIVPKVRGDEVYRPARDIVREVEALVERGCKEVTLLGQNVNSYGTHAPDGFTFAKLIRLISENTKIERIRFTSPHPKDCKEDLIEEYSQNTKLCSHMHLPLQSGSDAVLRRMQRAYNTKLFCQKVEALRAVRPGIGITTDIIVGFPGETEEEFQATLDLCTKIRFDMIYSFKYSPRPDTKAFGIADDVDRPEKESRLKRLNTLQTAIGKEQNQSLVGTEQAVLVEGEDRGKSGRVSGRTGNYKIVNFEGNTALIGKMVNVQIIEAHPFSLEGRL